MWPGSKGIAWRIGLPGRPGTGRDYVWCLVVVFFFDLHIYSFKTKKYNHQVGKYQCTSDPS